jgi:hypothetical protein
MKMIGRRYTDFQAAVDDDWPIPPQGPFPDDPNLKPIRISDDRARRLAEALRSRGYHVERVAGLNLITARREVRP